MPPPSGAKLKRRPRVNEAGGSGAPAQKQQRTAASASASASASSAAAATGTGAAATATTATTATAATTVVRAATAAERARRPDPAWPFTAGRNPSPAGLILLAWLTENLDHPYPSESQKDSMERETKGSRQQINDWFINARARKLKKLREQDAAERGKGKGRGRGRGKGRGRGSGAKARGKKAAPKAALPPRRAPPAVPGQQRGAKPPVQLIAIPVQLQMPLRAAPSQPVPTAQMVQHWQEAPVVQIVSAVVATPGAMDRAVLQSLAALADGGDSGDHNTVPPSPSGSDVSVRATAPSPVAMPGLGAALQAPPEEPETAELRSAAVPEPSPQLSQSPNFASPAQNASQADPDPMSAMMDDGDGAQDELPMSQPEEILVELSQGSPQALPFTFSQLDDARLSQEQEAPSEEDSSQASEEFD